MNFKAFLNEAPFMLDVDKSESIKDYLFDFKGLTPAIETFDSKHKLHTYKTKKDIHSFVMCGDDPVLYINYTATTFHSKKTNAPYQNAIQTKSLKKAESLSSSNTLNMYWTFLSKFDAVKSDNHHSIGGKSIWKRLLKKAYDDHMIFGYLSPHEVYYTKDDTFADFYKAVEDEAYGSNNRLFIEFAPDLDRLGL